MDKNNRSKQSIDHEEVVKVNVPHSDFLYYRYRKTLLDADKKRKADPDADITASGIILLSNKLDEMTYKMDTTTFGSYEDIINTLTFTLIKKLKDNTVPVREAQKQVLSSFLTFFVHAAFEEFFGIEEDEDEDFDD